MKLFHRVTGLVLALLLLASAVPIHVLAEPITYHGLDVRICHTAIGKKVKDAVPSIQVSTDNQTTQYQTDDSIQLSETWYHSVPTLEQIASDKKQEYSQYTYGNTNIYVRAIDANEVFAENEQYLCAITLTLTSGAFDENCKYSPTSNVHAEISATRAEVHVSVTPVAEDIIDWINFKCTNQGVVQLKDANPDYVYLYRANDGSEITEDIMGEPIGKHIINNSDYNIVTDAIDIMNKPCVTLYAVSVDDWYGETVSAVTAYGTYTIPMSDPYIQVNELKFGQAPTITEIGTTTGGKYHWSIANATFEGWFVDKEGKQPATAEADAYVIFNLRSYGLFNPDIEASDFTLRCGNQYYVGEYLLPRTASNAYKIAFFIPSNRISVTLEVIGDGGKMWFKSAPEQSSISLQPLLPGKYPSQDIVIEIEPGWYAQSLKVNGQVWDDGRNPFGGSTVRIPNDVACRAAIMSFEPTGNTIITLELGVADIITIDYGNHYAQYTGQYADETKWHSNAQYWVSETYATELCSTTAIIDNKGPLMQLKYLNTKPDGTGINVPATPGHFYWEPLAEYQNGQRDEITLYAIMECHAHFEWGAIDDEWEYREATPASCAAEGWIAHRHCPHCDQYQVQNNDGRYIEASPNDVKIAKLPHKHTVYLKYSNEQHIVQCENCADSYTENHNMENGRCVCGYATYVKGDFDGNGYVTDADAVYLLYYTIFSEDYPINQPADFNGDGYVTDADAVHLLYYTIFPEDYPL